MATRRQVREAFYAELETAADPHVTNVGQDHPNDDEDLPAIVHNDDYRKVPMNRGQGPTDVTLDGDGNEIEHIFTSLIEAQFVVTVLADDEQVKEDAYEAVRSHFEEYTHPVKDASALQSDVYRIEVQDSSSQDFEEREPIARGDSLSINVSFKRFYAKSVDPTTEVQQNVDADNDGTDDNNYTTN